MGKEAGKIFRQIFEGSKKDKNVLGMFLGGSRGKGTAKKQSDYDVYLIVKNKKTPHYRKKYPRNRHRKLDVSVFSLSEFQKYAKWGSPEECDRYNFWQITAMIDKTKNRRIQRIIDEKSRIPKKEAKKFIRGHIDSYINAVHRSLNCLRKNNLFGARLQASQSVPLFFDIIFALHNRRLRPYPEYMEWEMKTFPLAKLPIKPKQITRSISKILDDANAREQQKIFRVCEDLCRSEGYGKLFDSWGEDIVRIKTYRKRKKPRKKKKTAKKEHEPQQKKKLSLLILREKRKG